MKVAVWDTYVARNDGLRMHFDIIVPHELTDTQTIFAYGQAYLDEKQIQAKAISSNACRFCHFEEPTDEMLAHINEKGYFILEMENCA